MLSSSVDADTITIFVRDNGPPKQYISQEGLVSGYASEIAAQAIARAGYEPKLIALPWKRAQLNALQGKGVISAFSKTKDREQDYLFAGPMYQDRVLLVYQKNREFAFDQLTDLLGKKIGINRGSSYAGEFESYRKNLSLEPDDSNRQRLLRLAAGRIDAAILSGDIYTLHFNAHIAGVRLDYFSVAEKPIAIEPNYIGVPKTLKEIEPQLLKDQLDQALRNMQADGSIKGIFSRYSISTK